MKIGYDGKRAVQNFTGLGNYSRFILSILCRYHPQYNYLLYAPKERKNPSLDLILKQYPILKCILPDTDFWKKFSSIWRIWGISKQLQKENIDIFHGLSNELPLNIKGHNIKSIVTIHDLIFLRYPEYYHFIDRKIYTYKFRKACENADKIIAISECTKRDIINYFHISPDKISVIYQGCDDAFKKKITEKEKCIVREKYNLPTNYILNVGSIEERKNLLIILKALAHPQNSDIHLVAIGKRTKYTDQVEEFARQHNMVDRITILNKVPFEDLPALYQSADLFIYPSRFEGFGIPIIEAIHSGLPVIAATGSCLEEAGGPNSLYISPDDDESLAQAIYRILHDDHLREQMISQGIQYVERFDDKVIADGIIEVYQNVMR